MTEILNWLFEDAAHEDGDMFRQPVPVPASDIDAPNLVCLAVNEDYAAIIALALQRLTYHDAWVGTDADVQRACGQFNHIIGQLLAGACITCEPESPDLSACASIGPFHPSVEFWPNHPILSPGYVPPGADAPLWRTGAGLPFVDENDAILNPLAIFTPIILTEHWSVGVPSIRLHFTGTGEVTLTLTKAVQGCMAWIFPDDNPLVGQPVHLELISIEDILGLEWLTSVLDYLTGGVGTEVLHRLEFTTPGPHTITIWMLPIDDEFPFVGFGGGLRRIDFCGEITVEDDPVMAYDLNLSGCEIQLRLDEVVVDTIDLEACIRSIASGGAVRGNGCEIEQFDLEDEEWNPITNGDFQRVADPCPFGDDVTIIEDNPALEAVSLRLRRKGNTGAGASNLLQFVGENTDSVERDQVQLKSFWNNATAAAYRAAFHIKLANFDGTRIIAQFGDLASLWIPMFSTLRGIVLRAQSGSAGNFLEMRGSDNNARFSVDQNALLDQIPHHANASTTVKAIKVNARASGVTPAAGFGAHIDMQGDSSTTQNRSMARLDALWATATDASRGAELALKVGDYTGLVTPLRLRSIDGQTAIGVHGNAPITRQDVTGSSEYEVINSLLDVFEDYGWINNETDFEPDSGGGGAVATTEIVTEVYYDFTAFEYRFSSALSDQAEWDEGDGWGEGTEGFHLTQNFSAGRELIAMRCTFYITPINPLEFSVGLDRSQTNEMILFKDVYSLTETQFVAFNVPVFNRFSSTTPLGFWFPIDYNPAADGSIRIATLDLVWRGMMSHDDDENLEVGFPTHRVVKYVDLTDLEILDTWQFSQNPGGEGTDDLIIEQQE